MSAFSEGLGERVDGERLHPFFALPGPGHLDCHAHHESGLKVADGSILYGLGPCQDANAQIVQFQVRRCFGPGRRARLVTAAELAEERNDRKVLD